MVNKAKFCIILLCFVLLNVATGQPLFRLEHPLLPVLWQPSQQYLFSARCGEDVKIKNLFDEEMFHSYEWNMGNGVVASQYIAPQPNYESGTYDISLKVTKEQQFRIIKSITILQTDSTWVDCLFELFPDYYLEVYDSFGDLVIRTSPASNTPPPVTWNIDGILTESEFSIRVMEADADLFCSDDDMGTMLVPPNYTGGILEKVERNLEIAIETEEVNETTFTSSLRVNIVVQNKTPTSCEDSMYILRLKEPYSSYLWSNGSTDSIFITSEPGTFRVTVTDFNNCTGETSFILSQPPKADPIVVCEDNTLKCTNFNSFIRWLDSDKIIVSNSPTYTPTKEGVYYAESWGASPPCNAISSGIEWPSCELVNNENEQSLPKLNIYPNPASDYFNFSSVENLDEYNIFNPQGQIIKSGKLSSSSINISELSSGIYFVFAYSKNKMVFKSKLLVIK